MGKWENGTLNSVFDIFWIVMEIIDQNAFCFSNWICRFAVIAIIKESKRNLCNDNKWGFCDDATSHCFCWPFSSSSSSSSFCKERRWKNFWLCSPLVRLRLKLFYSPAVLAVSSASSSSWPFYYKKKKKKKKNTEKGRKKGRREETNRRN